MLIKVRCSACGQESNVEIDRQVQQQVKCAACGAAIGIAGDLRETWRCSSQIHETCLFPGRPEVPPDADRR